MAVVVQCYHCSNILELDEGFRGGVCRCSQCGSLLQVPRANAAEAGARERPAAPGARPESPGRPETPGAGTGLSRGQFDPRSGSGVRPARPDAPPGTGAFARRPDPAEVSAGRGVASSVAGGGVGVRKVEKVLPLDAVGGIPSVAVHVRQIKKSRNMLWLGLGLALVVVVLGVVALVVVMMSTGGENGKKTTGGGEVRGGTVTGGGTTGGGTTGGGTVTPAVVRTGFFGVELTGARVVIAIDAGQSMQDVYDFVSKGAMTALEGMRPEQQAKIAIWRTPGPVVLPASGWTNKSNLTGLRKELNDIFASGGHDAEANMTAVMKLGADQVIFITGKTGMSDGLTRRCSRHGAGRNAWTAFGLRRERGIRRSRALPRRRGGSI